MTAIASHQYQRTLYRDWNVEDLWEWARQTETVIDGRGAAPDSAFRKKQLQFVGSNLAIWFPCRNHVKIDDVRTEDAALRNQTTPIVRIANSLDEVQGRGAISLITITVDAWCSAGASSGCRDRTGAEHLLHNRLLTRYGIDATRPHPKTARLSSAQICGSADKGEIRYARRAFGQNLNRNTQACRW